MQAHCRRRLVHGLSRVDPAPVGSTVVTDEWSITVLEQFRGDDALAAVVAANQFNDPPPHGFEYVSVLVHAQSVSPADEFMKIEESSFRITGNARVLYGVPSTVDPAPQFGFDLFPGGEGRGWMTFIVQSDDKGLMLRYGPGFFSDDSNARFLALDDGAGVPLTAAPLAESTGLGVDRESPVPLGELATTDRFEVRVLEVVRGEDALAMAREANQFNDDPDPGMEYVQVRMWVRNIGDGGDFASIDDGWSKTIGSENVLWDRPSVVEPTPDLDARLYVGGVWEGWVTLQATINETDVLLVFEPPFDFGDGNRRYLALS